MPSSAQAVREIDQSEYLERIEQTRRIAEAGISDPSEERMQSLRESLGLPVSVTVRGQRFEIQSDSLLESLEGTESNDFRAAGARLTRMREEILATASSEIPDRDEIRSALSGAYGGIRWRLSVPERIRALVQDLLSAIGWLIQRSLGAAAPAIRVGSWLFLIGAVAALAFFLSRLRLVPHRSAPVSESPEEAVDWNARARLEAARGDLRSAVRFQFRSLLDAMAAAGMLRRSPSLTAGDARSASRRMLPETAGAIDLAGAAFERAAYTRREITHTDHETVLEAERLVRTS